MMLNTAVLAPIPSARVRTTIGVQLFLRASERTAKRASCRRASKKRVRSMR
jgi:hypothetical protein